MTDRKPGLVAFYNIRPGNGAGLFLQPRNPHGCTSSDGKNFEGDGHEFVPTQLHYLHAMLCKYFFFYQRNVNIFELCANADDI